MRVFSMSDKIKIGRKAFEIYIDANCKDSALVDFAQKLGISVFTLKRDYLVLYKNRTISPKPSDEELMKYHSGIVSHLSGVKSVDTNMEFINELLAQKYAKELLAFLANSKYSLGEIFGILKDYVRDYPQSSNVQRVLRINSFIKNNIDNPLLENKTVTSSSLKNEEDEKMMMFVRRIIDEFIASQETSLDSIMSKYSKVINYKEFSKKVDSLKEGSLEDQRRLQLLSDKFEQIYSLYEELIPTVVNQIKARIGNELEPFTILDYYRLTDVEPKKFLHRAHKMVKDGQLDLVDYRVLHQTLTSYEQGSISLSEEQLLEFENDFPLNEIDKRKIIDYIKSIPAPLNKNTYNQGCFDYVTGTMPAKTFLSA